MKRIALLAIGLLAISCTSNFRETQWHMDKEQVMNIETAELVKEDEQELVYRGTLNGLDVDIRYTFYPSGGIMFARYEITTTHTEAFWYVREFNSLNILLVEKYGKPISNKKTFNSSFMQTRWDTAGNSIDHSLTISEKGVANHLIRYSQSLGISESQNEKALDAL